MGRARRWLLIGALAALAGGATASNLYGPRSRLAALGLAASTGRAEAAARRVGPALQRDFATAGLPWGAPLLLRVFKEEAMLEVWARREDAHVLFRRYPVCRYSGTLGPKLRQGDRQAPEGFYTVAPGQMNPASQFHLSFDLGYPNAYDRAHGRTGDFLMVHGACVSVGCFAMGDAAIEEIYTLMAAAFAAGQAAVPVHAFPFRYDRADLAQRLADPSWGPFWRELQPAWDAFERDRRAPQVSVVDGRYRIAAAP